MATIITKNSGTASSVPTGAQLTAGELAVNTADKRLFTKNGGGTVVELGTNPSSLTLPNGTANGVPYLNASKVLTSGSALWFDGTNFGIGTGGNALNQQSVIYKAGANAVYHQIANGSTGLAATNGIRLGLTSGGTGELYSPTTLISYIDNSEAMRLTSTGLGIGTSSVTDKLTVAGNISTPNNNGFSSKFTNGAAYVLLKTDPSNIIQLGDIAGYSKAGAQLQFFASGSVAATFDQAGNLGLGATPSAWSGYGAVLQMQNGGAFVNNALNDVHVANNCYYNAGWKYTATNASSRYEQFNGGHYWFNAPSGTAGNAITFTQAMTLDASGNLLVAQTGQGPANSYSMCFGAGNTGGLDLSHVSGAASGVMYARFNYNATTIGSITQNGTTGVLYNLTSDYRLKNNPVPVTGAKEFINALQPKTWDWWDGSGKGVGFIAHEFMEVAKYSGNGTKDAVDDDGNPVYQSIQPSSSEVMANLVAYVQELRAEFDAYKAAHP